MADERPRGFERAADELLEKIRNKGRQIAIALPGSEELRLLEYFQANANVGGEELTHIIVLPDARKIEALEEFLHGTQFRISIVKREGTVKAEIHVKRFMMRHASLLGLSADDVLVLREMLGENENERFTP